ncbi:MAG: hypothetical protein A3K65_08715 [Euryarchaeota archaeon RBG_16_68_12]|nr:MAG: hypothetical protein A3K65_08715 [Euryarchaeota archaeon RBG_16_68_12]
MLGGGSGGNRPQVAVHGSHIVIGYTATGTDGPYVAAVASSDGGGTWGSATAVGPANSCPPPSWRPEPSIAVSRDGLFGLTWSAERSCSTGWGDDAEAWVSTSADGGETFRSPVKAGGPPGWAWGRALGDQLVFDDESRPYVTWHSISPGWTSASVYVASAPTATGTYTNGSFTTRLETSGGNSTAQENLAVGPRGLVFLLWERFDPTANASDPSVGIFLRPVVGEAEGDVVVYAQPDPTLEVVVRDPATGAIVARLLGAGNPTTIPGLVPATYPVWVHAGNSSVPAGALPVKPWSRTVFTVVVGERPGGPALPVIAVAGAGVAVLVAALAGAAVWRRRRRDRSPPPGPSAGP